jgi:hypothetical protein
MLKPGFLFGAPVWLRRVNIARQRKLTLTAGANDLGTRDAERRNDWNDKCQCAMNALGQYALPWGVETPVHRFGAGRYGADSLTMRSGSLRRMSRLPRKLKVVGTGCTRFSNSPIMGGPGLFAGAYRRHKPSGEDSGAKFRGTGRIAGGSDGCRASRLS